MENGKMMKKISISCLNGVFAIVRVCVCVHSSFQFVHRPYPMEVLMFPASGVGLGADGC